MQVYALFAVLSYLSTSYAAPLLIGIPGIAQIDVKLPSLPKGSAVQVPDLVLPSISIPNLAALPTGTAGVAAAQSAISAALADGKAAVASLADQLGVAIPSDVISVSINTELLNVKGSATGAPSVPVPTGLPVDPAVLLQKVGELVGGLQRPTKASDAVQQLQKVGADLEAASKTAVASLKSGTNYSQYLGQSAALVRNLNNYIDNLPKTVATDAAVKQAAAQVDSTLATYLKSLTSASGSSSKFGDDFFKAGFNVKTITNSLLKQTSAAIPTSGLKSLFPGFSIGNFA